jgi:hypothetical protein
MSTFRAHFSTKISHFPTNLRGAKYQIIIIIIIIIMVP